jgi:hypothetical protein
MGAQTKNVERSSQATPFAEDVLKTLSQGIMGGGTEAGHFQSPSILQRESGTAMRQFIESLSRGPGDLVGSLGQIHSREMDRGVAGLREGFSGMGGRFSTPLAREEGRMRREGAADLTATIGGIEQQHIGQMIQALSQMFNMGTQELAPFLQMAGLGVIPDEVIAQPNPFLQMGTALAGGLGTMLAPGFGAGGRFAP